MATNSILPFASTDTSTNLLTDAEYSADGQRLIGNQPGVARLKLVNKALRQSSIVSAGIAQLIADAQATNVTDALTAAQIATLFKAALSSSGLFTTAARFDSSTKVATTEFLQRMGVQFNSLKSYTGTDTFKVDDLGRWVRLVSASAFNMTLMASSAAPDGSVIYCKNIAAGACTILRAGTDTMSIGASTVNSIVLSAGDDLMLVSNGLNAWVAVSGTAVLGLSPAFARLLSASGYQKLPPDELGRRWTKQWGSSLATVTSGALSPRITFPINFPTAICGVLLTPIGNNSGISFTVDSTTLAADGFNWRSNFTGSQGFSWEATGY